MISSLDSSLLYIRADGTKVFVHDSLRDFFLARWLSESEENSRFFWSRITNPQLKEDQTQELERRINEGEVSRKNNFDSYAVHLLPYHELGLVKNMLGVYCELAPDVTPLVEAGMKLADECGDGLTAGKSDEIRMNIAEIIISANYINPNTTDKFIQLLLKHGGGYGFMSSLQWTSEMILSFILQTGRDPYKHLEKACGGNKGVALRSLGMSYHGIKRYDDSIDCWKQLMSSEEPDAWDYIHFAHTYMGAGKFDEAIALFEQGKAKLPRDDIDRCGAFIKEGIRMAEAREYDEFWLF